MQQIEALLLLFFSVVSFCCFHLLTQCPRCQRAIFLCLLSLGMHTTFLTSEQSSDNESVSNSDAEPEMQDSKVEMQGDNNIRNCG